MHVVTAGYPYIDIDAYAGVLAYAELLALQGEQAIATSTAPLNESITATVLSWGGQLERNYQPASDDVFSMIDLSNPEFFDRFVDPDRVVSVLDHHVGFEQHWQDRIGEGAMIEFIGAACTIVYEQWVAAGLQSSISQTSARLLICGILDNTLNFGAKLTTDRDRQAYAALLPIADLGEDWPHRYFDEIQAAIEQDMSIALKNDHKLVPFSSFKGPVSFGQLTVWDIDREHYFDTFKDTLAALGSNWFLNLISLKDGKSYFISDVPEIQQWLGQLLGLHFEGAVAAADHLWLRKEIIQVDQTEK